MYNDNSLPSLTKHLSSGQMHEFGKIVLNKNPENYHRDVEQAAFSLGSMVPGIEDSPDPLLQFRMFFYRDAQYHRIGINLHQIPGTQDHFRDFEVL